MDTFGRYVGLIEYLVRGGLVVYGNDHRGHGRTALSPKNLGDFRSGGVDLLVEDVERLMAITKEEHRDALSYFLGTAWGPSRRNNA